MVGLVDKVGRGEEEWWGLLQGWEQGRRHGETWNTPNCP